MTTGWKIYWIWVAVTLGLYFVMVSWSLPKIGAAAGGLVPFDMRPGGYSFDEARAFLTALSAEGKAFYETVQHRLDRFYPAMLAIVLAVPLWHLMRNRSVVWRGLAVAIVVLGAVADYVENDSVSRMLAVGSDDLGVALVDTASLWSQIKAGATTVAMVLLLVLLLIRFYSNWRNRAGAS